MTSLLILPALLAKVVLINDLAELVLRAGYIFFILLSGKNADFKNFLITVFLACRICHILRDTLSAGSKSGIEYFYHRRIGRRKNLS